MRRIIITLTLCLIGGWAFAQISGGGSGGGGAVTAVVSAFVDGWNVTMGTKSDTPCTLPASGTACSQIAIEKASANAINSPPPLGTTGGWTPLRINAITNTAVAIKGSTGQLGMLQCTNNAAAVTYFQVYNVAQGSVTVGTTLPTLSIAVPATSSAGFALPVSGMQFSTAISIAATTTATGSTAPGTTGDCNVGYN
ncbi:MAG: hypothetical protein KGL39_05285 [Patescibacteria group bacterium]|nr:hypothetical protein [Patescibacteria group bacterium]